VELNSGGPVMTILEVKNNGWVVCEWFDKNHTYNKKEFLESNIDTYEMLEAFTI
ncbi:DUF2158 domain-containing protein, partial [Acinetobacter baumannii]|nr:DUF2158 domain-containing protein [Acinetobacter baumannii]